MFSISIDDLMTEIRAERDRMRAILSGVQCPDSNDLKVLADVGGNPDVDSDKVLIRYCEYVARSQALIERYEANALDEDRSVDE